MAADESSKRKQRLPSRATGKVPTLREEAYPAIDYIPQRPYLTPCEVLCLFAYRRAIPSRDYHAPLRWVAGLAPDDYNNFLHQAIPEPKPAESPMADAERKVMELLRDRRLHLFRKKGDSYEEVPSDTMKYAVVVTTRDDLAPDARAPQQDQESAASYLASHSLLPIVFLTSEVRECLTREPADSKHPPANAPTVTLMVNGVAREFDRVDLTAKVPRPPRFTEKRRNQEGHRKATETDTDVVIQLIAASESDGQTNSQRVQQWGRYTLRTQLQADTQAMLIVERFADPKHDALRRPRGNPRLRSLIRSRKHPN
jgi:hypothetical protein